MCTPLAAMPLIAYERWLNFSESLKERGFERERTLDRLRRKRKRPRLTLAPTSNNAVDLACIDKSNNFRLKSAPFNQHANWATNWAGVIYGTLTIMLCACKCVVIGVTLCVTWCRMVSRCASRGGTLCVTWCHTVRHVVARCASATSA